MICISTHLWHTLRGLVASYLQKKFVTFMEALRSGCLICFHDKRALMHIFRTIYSNNSGRSNSKLSLFSSSLCIFHLNTYRKRLHGCWRIWVTIWSYLVRYYRFTLYFSRHFSLISVSVVIWESTIHIGHGWFWSCFFRQQVGLNFVCCCCCCLLNFSN